MPVMTHKGWFWLCPVYLSLADSDGVAVEARRAWLEPLFTVCELLEAARIFLSSVFIRDYEPTFMFKVTGELTRVAI